MSKTFTLIYLYENLDNEKKNKKKSNDLSFNEFSDVLNELNIKTLSPPDHAVHKILEYAKNYIR